MSLRFAVFFLVSTLLGLVALFAFACGGPAFVIGGADGGPTVDAGTDAPLPFCSTVDASFCSDFDYLPLTQWSMVSTTPGSTGVEDSDASVSPPNSYLASTPGVASPANGGDASAPAARAILTEVALPKGQTVISFDVRIDQISFPDTTSLTASVYMAAYTQGPDYTLALELHPTASAPFTAALLELTTGPLGILTPKVTELPGTFTQTGVWYSVQISFGIDTSFSDAGLVPASISVTPLGQTPVPKDIILSPPADAIGGARTLSIGNEATPPVGAAQLRFDNVTYSQQ